MLIYDISRLRQLSDMSIDVLVLVLMDLMKLDTDPQLPALAPNTP